jgi:hypothetical protein
MITRDLDRLLVHLAKVETSLSRIYERLSKKESFRQQVQGFWRELMNEELAHARVFNEIREKALAEDTFEVDVRVKDGQLRSFVDRARDLIKIVEEDVSESDAYSLCAQIEGDLDEAKFLDSVRMNDAAMTKRLDRVKADTKKHRIVLVNYSRGIR